MPSQIRSSFKVFRAIIFVFCILLSLGCTAVLSILLLREWGSYGMNRRAIVVGLTAAHGVGAILLYLMLVVRFRVWLDAVRILFYSLSVLGGTIVLILFNSSSPCPDIGSRTLCHEITVSVTIIGLVITGSMVLYAIGLGVTALTPPPPTILPPEDSKRFSRQSTAESVSSETGLLSQADQSLRLELESFKRSKRAFLPSSPRSTIKPRTPASVSHTSLAGKMDDPGFSVTMSSSSTTSSASPAYSVQAVPMYLGSYEYLPLPSPYELPPSRSARPLSSTFSQNGRLSPKGYPFSPSVSTDSGPTQTSQIRSYEQLQSKSPVLGAETIAHPSSRRLLNVPPSYPSSQDRTVSLLPNPFVDVISRSTTPMTPMTPMTPNTSSSDWHTSTGHHDISLSFGQHGFPLPPSYNATLWPQYTNEYLNPYTNTQSQTPVPPTPMSLRPAVRAKPPYSPIKPHRVDSVRSMSVSPHSTTLPRPPQVATLPPHPRLGGKPKADLSRAGWSTNVQDPQSVASLSPAMTPLSASTFGSQTVPTDIPKWFASIHNTRVD